ncbi:BT_3928 family protein [Mangrovibacterium marinum]|uniref:Putative membrane protein YphA (DoxX/SURF4 family) n=1 Tax=Mangrovibacterium marinum TaxID=1639118 RepID=A0A2T5C3N0_9BACT|nr:BT_3928 family protein [Mangrovibacterium marinum]PTN09390.1 putative membrane protein YphA (DoxX/SURF4 family) [Mangrovibacterium marinum]
MKYIWHLCRILLGLVFIFSGFVKGIDPLGSAYKFTDYFHAWNMDALVALALPLGILLSLAEFVTGIALVTNVFNKVFSWFALLFMGFFTIITLIVALNNPVTDCGCFGDALTLTNWETFYKNIVFSACAVILVGWGKKFRPAKFPLIATIMAGATVLVFGYLIDYSYNHLPIIDFRPYKIGTNIPAGMEMPADAEPDEYANIFVYENRETGKQQEFTEDNYPWQDSLTWKFVSMENELVKKGYEPPIHNFSIETIDGEDIKDFFLYDDAYTFMLISTDLDEANWSPLERIKALSSYAQDNGMHFIGLTASLLDDAQMIAEEKELPFEFFNADEITLKTIVRANPGLILLKKGTVIDKWHFNDIPTVEEFQKQLTYLGQREVE